MFDHFNLLAPIYDRLISPPDAERLLSLLKLPTAGRMLDAGGGTGRVSSQLSSMVGELILTDVSEGMLRQAQIKGNLSPSLAHVETLPFANEIFDRVLVVDALHHFANQQDAIADLIRILKPGGRLVIEEPDLIHRRVELIAIMEKIALMQSHFLSPEEIGRIVKHYGLNPVIERDDKFTAWVVVDK